MYFCRAVYSSVREMTLLVLISRTVRDVGGGARAEVATIYASISMLVLMMVMGCGDWEALGYEGVRMRMYIPRSSMLPGA